MDQAKAENEVHLKLKAKQTNENPQKPNAITRHLRKATRGEKFQSFEIPREESTDNDAFQ